MAATSRYEDSWSFYEVDNCHQYQPTLASLEYSVLELLVSAVRLGADVIDPGIGWHKCELHACLGSSQTVRLVPLYSMNQSLAS